MRRSLALSASLACLVLLAACRDEPAGEGAGGGAEPEAAWRLERVEPTFADVAIEVAESAPPRFTLRLPLTLPTPGWTLGVETPRRTDDGRILVRVRGTPPPGVVAQVLTETEIRVPLGRLPVGRYLVDVRFRRGEEPFRPAGAFLVEARGRK